MQNKFKLYITRVRLRNFIAVIGKYCNLVTLYNDFCKSCKGKEKMESTENLLLPGTGKPEAKAQP